MMPLLPIPLSRCTLLAVTLGAPILLSGCFLQVRSLRDDNNMLRAEVIQISQDLNAATGRLTLAQNQNAELRAERDRLQSEVENLRGRVETLQRVMDSTQRQTAETLMRDMEERVSRENQLRLDLDEAAARLETASNDKQLMEAELGVMREEMMELKASLDRTTTRLEEINALLQTTRAERDDARAERDDYRRQTQALSSDREDVAANLEAVSSELRDREKDIAALRRKVEEMEQAAEEQATRAAEAREIDATRSAQLRTALQQALRGFDVAFAEGGEARFRASSDVFFDTGTVNLSTRGREILDRAAAAIRDREYAEIRVEGHTDSTPVRAMPFVDNWDLAATRAATVARYLAIDAGLNAARIKATSQAFHAPVASNDSAVGRRDNRRVEIVVVP